MEIITFFKVLFTLIFNAESIHLWWIKCWELCRVSLCIGLCYNCNVAAQAFKSWPNQTVQNWIWWLGTGQTVHSISFKIFKLQRIEHTILKKVFKVILSLKMPFHQIAFWALLNGWQNQFKVKQESYFWEMAKWIWSSQWRTFPIKKRKHFIELKIPNLSSKIMIEKLKGGYKYKLIKLCGW